MNEYPNRSPEDDDPDIARLLVGVGRFSPQRGFEDRVVGRVRVPLPQWLRGLRGRMRALTSGVTGWTVLAAFSLATAATWTAGAVVGAQYWGEISAAGGELASAAIRVTSQDVTGSLLPVLGEVRAALAIWVGRFGLDLQTAAIGYGVVVLLCAVAMRWLTAEPARGRGSNAAS